MYTQKRLTKQNFSMNLTGGEYLSAENWIEMQGLDEGGRASRKDGRIYIFLYTK
jgi:hypothetical protein